MGKLIAGVVCAAFLAAAAPAALSAETVLRAATAFPETIEFTKSFHRFVAKVNKAGAGVVGIEIIGGPETIPQSQQPDATRRGVLDIHQGPASYYLGLVPEGDALVGSNRTPMEARANGGFALLQRIFADKLNVHILGHFDGGVGFHIFLREPPPRTNDGGIDLTGIAIRSQPIYREFFRALGARTITVPVGEAYTAFERGIVDGTGWVQMNLADLGWDRFLRTRIDPAFFAAEILVIVNLDRWRSLSPEARAILERLAIEYEQESYDYFRDFTAREDRRQRAAGMNVITLTGAARAAYLKQAHEVPWSRLAERDATHVEELRAKYYVE